VIAAACGHGWLPGVEEGDNGEDALVGVQGGVDSELAEDVVDVLFYRTLRYPEGLGDPGVGLTGTHPRKHLSFSWRERIEGVGSPCAAEQFDDEPGVEDGAAFADPGERAGEFIEVGYRVLEQVADAAGCGRK
jgi:hypothetical protein